MGETAVLAAAVVAAAAISAGATYASRPNLPGITKPKPLPPPPKAAELPPPPSETEIGEAGEGERRRKGRKFGISQTLLVRPGLGDASGILQAPSSLGRSSLGGG